MSQSKNKEHHSTSSERFSILNQLPPLDSPSTAATPTTVTFPASEEAEEQRGRGETPYINPLFL